MSLNRTIQELSHRFARELLASLHGASLEELISLGGAGHVPRGTGRPAKAKRATSAERRNAPSHRTKRVLRRSTTDLDKLVAQIVAVVSKHRKDGIRAEQIRKTLGIERRELPKPLELAFESRKIAKRGRKRGTAYFPA
jgi:hypothetical protein